MAMVIGAAQLGMAETSINPDDPTLKDLYLLQEAKPLKKIQACDEINSKFSRMDLDKYSYGSRTIGIDISGRIWEIKKNSRGICTIENTARLGVSTIVRLNGYGDDDNGVYQYEASTVCVYFQSARESYRIKKICYEPLGLVNKFAPYTSP
jgi:hypothetical protein